MKKNRLGYLLIVLLTLFALYQTERRLFFSMSVLEILFPLFLQARLNDEVRNLKINFSTTTNRLEQQESEIEFTCQNDRLFIAAGLLQFTLCMENKLFSKVKESPLTMPLTKKNDTFLLTLHNEDCGEVNYSLKNCVVYDLFGICRKQIHLEQMQYTTVYPKVLKFEWIRDANAYGRDAGGMESRNQKGSDPSEIFAFHEYIPGDDIRSIHWKLSVKHENLIAKESSRTIHLDTLLMFDSSVENEIALIKAAVSFTTAMGEKMIAQGMQYGFAYVQDRKLIINHITNENERMASLTSWMSSALGKEENMGIRLLNLDQRKYSFTKLIYVTADSLSDELKHMRDAKVTAVHIEKEGRLTKSVENDTYQILNIPLSALENGNCHLYF